MKIFKLIKYNTFLALPENEIDHFLHEVRNLLEIGQGCEIHVTEMPESEYNELPEFEGF